MPLLQTQYRTRQRLDDREQLRPMFQHLPTAPPCAGATSNTPRAAPLGSARSSTQLPVRIAQLSPRRFIQEPPSLVLPRCSASVDLVPVSNDLARFALCLG